MRTEDWETLWNFHSRCSNGYHHTNLKGRKLGNDGCFVSIATNLIHPKGIIVYPQNVATMQIPMDLTSLYYFTGFGVWCTFGPIFRNTSNIKTSFSRPFIIIIHDDSYQELDVIPKLKLRWRHTRVGQNFTQSCCKLPARTNKMNIAACSEIIDLNEDDADWHRG